MITLMQDFAEMVECLHVEDALSGSVYMIHGETPCWELEKMDKDQVTGGVTTCDIEVTDVSSDSAMSLTLNWEIFISHPILALQWTARVVLECVTWLSLKP
ncbi:hypothetical protein LOK49_LG01G00429 [Camellia lanceoleosa]|uniref:Uncharacterized protein n=1 Tax=Camellia lanceoleosa TaxID=1840588 RepID=A0ACC0J082_9ERIC|nr:hypothetical protein LOK49_LG01G00429 [Camellia lanceoleosa]